MLEARNITRQYGPAKALSSVSATVAAGAVTVVLGPSGAGKSTLLRVMGVIDEPDQGEVLLDGKVISRPPANSEKDTPWPTITLVFQQLFLWPHLTLAENIRLPAKLRGRTLNRYHQTLDELGIAAVASRYPNQVSIGQRQRAAIARALLLEPRFLLLDEITAALDVEQIAALLDVLVSIIDRGIGVLVVTHHVGFARHLLNRGGGGSFLFLEAGTVTEVGGASQFGSPTTARLRQFLQAMELVG